MSYSKKDEDADQAIVKVDRTAVFQEGGHSKPFHYHPKLTMYNQPVFSTTRPYPLENAGSSLPRLRSYSSRGNLSLPMKLQTSSSESQSSFKTRIPPFGR